MTSQQIAQSALDVQTACNLSGVAQSFARVMLAIRALPDCTGTDYTNRHPAARLYADQIMYLSGGGTGADGETYRAAYAACERLAAGEVTV